MAYVGKKPADSIIQSSDIQDGIITLVVIQNLTHISQEA